MAAYVDAVVVDCVDHDDGPGLRTHITTNALELQEIDNALALAVARLRPNCVLELVHPRARDHSSASLNAIFTELGNAIHEYARPHNPVTDRTDTILQIIHTLASKALFGRLSDAYLPQLGLEDPIRDPQLAQMSPQNRNRLLRELRRAALPHPIRSRLLPSLRARLPQLTCITAALLVSVGLGGTIVGGSPSYAFHYGFETFSNAPLPAILISGSPLLAAAAAAAPPPPPPPPAGDAGATPFQAAATGPATTETAAPFTVVPPPIPPLTVDPRHEEQYGRLRALGLVELAVELPKLRQLVAEAEGVELRTRASRAQFEMAALDAAAAAAQAKSELDAMWQIWTEPAADRVDPLKVVLTSLEGVASDRATEAETKAKAHDQARFRLEQRRAQLHAVEVVAASAESGAAMRQVAKLQLDIYYTDLRLESIRNGGIIDGQGAAQLMAKKRVLTAARLGICTTYSARPREPAEDAY